MQIRLMVLLNRTSLSFIRAVSVCYFPICIVPLN